MRRIVLIIACAVVAAGHSVAQSFDDAMFQSLGVMQAALIFAADKCPGSLDPNAEAAVAAVARQDTQKMKAIVVNALVAINQQAQRVGVSKQCKNIVEAYGPRGAVKDGAWRPTPK